MKKLLPLFMYILAVTPAYACEETAEQKQQRFAEFDSNKDGLIEQKEFHISEGADYIKYHDRNKDGKLSREEFAEISFVRCAE